MNGILPTEEYTEVDGRAYLNPQVGVDESNAFIENLRNTQQSNTQQISADTQALGTDVPSSLGGLTGANSYWTSRYQTPQTNTLVQDLRAAAQATALNEALANEQAIWKKRYQDAYRNYQKRQYNKANTPTTTGGGGGGGGDTKGDVEESSTGNYTGVGKLTLTDEDFAEGGAFLVDPASGNIIGEGFSGNNPRYVRQEDGSYKKYTASKTAPLGSNMGMIQLNVGSSGIMQDYLKPISKNNSSNGFSGR